MKQILALLTFILATGFSQGQNLKPPPPPSPNAPSKKERELERLNHNCVKSTRKTFTSRLKNYPFDISSQIQIVSFKNDCCEDSLPRMNDTICYSKLTEIKTLTFSQVDKLTDILYNYGYKGPISVISEISCYIPRDAILFIDRNGRVIEFIEICFECQKYRLSSRQIEFGEECDQKYDMLKKFFRAAGIEYGTMTTN